MRQTLEDQRRQWHPTGLNDFPFTFHFHALEKEMATHSSVLAWRIPGIGDPGGLPSMGSHRVGQDWSDLAAAAVTLEGSALMLSWLYIAHRAPLPMGFSWKEYWSGLPFPSLRNISDPRIELMSCISCIADGFFVVEPPEKALEGRAAYKSWKDANKGDPVCPQIWLWTSVLKIHF